MTTKPATPDNRYPAGEQADLMGKSRRSHRWSAPSKVLILLQPSQGAKILRCAPG